MDGTTITIIENERGREDVFDQATELRQITGNIRKLTTMNTEKCWGYDIYRQATRKVQSVIAGQTQIQQ